MMHSHMNVKFVIRWSVEWWLLHQAAVWTFIYTKYSKSHRIS